VLEIDLLAKLIAEQRKLSVSGEEVMQELLAEVRDLVSYNGRKGSAMTLFTVFQVLAYGILGRKVFIIWKEPDKPYVCNLESGESGEEPTGNRT
jgi:hypothetical protein